MSLISGVLVVRSPDKNFDLEGRGAFTATPPRIGDIFHGGVDRMEWFDLDEAHFNRTLPGDLMQIRRSLTAGSTDFTGIKLCYDLAHAKRVLEWTNREVIQNGIIAVRSQKLIEIKKRSLSLESCEIDWLGFDFVSLGHWSLLEGGMFASPSCFSRVPWSVGYLDARKNNETLEPLEEIIVVSIHVLLK